MNLIYNAQDALFEFMQKGGDVLYLIALLAFFMWLLIFERIWYFYFIYNNELKEAVDKWEPRPDKSSWNSKAIRGMLISKTSSRINANLPFIKLCVGVAPLFGLFGTIAGMMEVFHLLAITGGGDAKAMAGGVSKAIIPPMAGLAVALIGNFAQQYIKNVTQRESDMLYEKLAIQ